MKYNINWFDTNKAGKVIVRKYSGEVNQNETSFTFTYNGKEKTISKEDCIAWVLNNNGRWQAV